MDTANVTERGLPLGRVLGKRALLYIALLVFAFALVLLLNTSNASATTTINADIAVDTTLSTADDYVIDGDLTVLAGVRLWIDPGVYVNFTDGSSLTIEGYLYANGTLGNPIRMSSDTGTTPGAWDGIIFNGPSGSRMTYFEVNYADDAIAIVDTTVSPFSGTVNNAAGNGVSVVRTTGSLTASFSGLVLNSIGGDGFYFLAVDGNVAATVTNCAAFNVGGVGVYAYSPNANASVSVVGGLFSSPTAGMDSGVVASAYWNASVSVSGGAAFYFAEIGAYALSDSANAAVSLNGITLGNVEGAGSSYGAASITAARFGVASVSMTNMVVRNATLGAFGWALDGGVNIAVSGVTFENVTDTAITALAWELSASVTVTNSNFNNTATAIYVESNQTATISVTGTDITNTSDAVDVWNVYGGVNVAMTRVNITGITGYGVNVLSEEAGANIVLTDVSITGLFGSGSINCELNTTATVTATRFSATDLMLGLSVGTNGNVVLDVSDSTLTNALTGISVFTNGAVTATIDPTLINHTLYGVYIVAGGNVALTMLDVDMNDTTYCVYVYSVLGNINFSWTNGVVTGADSTIVGVYLYSDEGSVSASLTNVDIEMYSADLSWWWNSGSEVNSLLFVDANTTATIALTDVYVNNSWAGVFATAAFDDLSFTADGVEIVGVYKGIYLSTAGELTLDVTDLIVNNPSVCMYGYIPFPDFLYSYVIEGYASGDIVANIDGVYTNIMSGVYLYSDLGSIDFTATNYVRDLNWWATYEMISLIAPEGSVTVAMTDVSMNMWPFWFYNSYGVYIYANLSVSASFTGFELLNATNGIAIESLIGDVDLTMTGVTVSENVDNGILVYADDGELNAVLEGVLVDHSYNGNGIVMQSMGDMSVTMTDVGVNDSAINGMLMLSVMGNVVLDLTNIDVANSGEDGMNVVSANGWIDVVIDPSSISSSYDVGMYLEAAGAVTLDAVDTVFEDNWVGVEIHSQAGGIAVNLANVEFNGNFMGLFAEADNDDVVVDCTESVLTENYYGMFLNTLSGDVYITVDNSSFMLGGFGIWALSSNDIFADIVDTEFLGQSQGGVTLWADHDVVVVYLRDSFDGSLADNAQIFLPSVVEEEYVMIDPDEWTTNSWLTVNLDWEFEFNGVYYTQVTMSRYGWLGFGVTDVNTTYANFGPGAPNMIAAAQNPNWNNHEYPGIGYKKVDGAIIFHWYVWQTGSEQLKNVFQIWLFEDGDIEIRYAMMETKNVNHPYYAWGINFNGGQHWDVRDWTYGPFSWDVFYNDWKSIHFTMERMSAGYGSWVAAFGNVTATVKDSSVSHFLTGGMLFECTDGVLNVEISNTSFSFIGGFSQPWAAVSFIDHNGTMDVEMTEMEFYFIMGLAIALWDTPTYGGVSNMAVTNSYFEQVAMCAVMWSTVDDSDLEGAYALTATKTVANNVGVHAGYFDTQTWIDTPLASWDLAVTTVFQDNSIEGNLDPWLMQYWGPPAPPITSIGPAQFYSYVGLWTSADAASSVSVDATVMNNVLTDAAWGGFGAVGIEADVESTGAGAITSDLNVLAQDNQISDWYVPFGYGIWAMITQTMTGTDAATLADLEVNVDYLNNVLEFDYGSASTGLGAQGYQSVTGGLGMGMMDFNVNVLDNTVWYAVDGVYVYSEASIMNAWGATMSDVFINIQRNDIWAYSDGVYAQARSGAAFSHYFPPYEVEVSATSDMTFAMDISANDITYGDTGIAAYANSWAQEDYYGVFTSATSTTEGQFDIYNNYLQNWYDYDSYAIDVEAWIDSTTGQAYSTLNVDHSVVDNVIYAYGSYGIFVGTYADAMTLDYRYQDTAYAAAVSNVEVLRNQIWYAYDGIMVDQEAWADRGESAAYVSTVVLVQDNILEQTYADSIWVYTYGYMMDPQGSPYVNAQGEVTVVNNTMSGQGDSYSWGIDVEFWSYSYYQYDYYGTAYGSALIAENTISNFDGAIYFYSEGWNLVPVTIVDNVIDSCDTGIEVDTGLFLIQDNLLTNILYEGVAIYGGTGSILDNILTGMEGEEAWGIDVYVADWDGGYLAEDVLIQGNDISGFGGDGIWAEDTYGMTIVDNLISNCGGSGIWIEGDYDEFDDYLGMYLTIADNMISNVYYDGIYVGYYMDIIIEDNLIDGVATEYGIWVDGCEEFSIMDNVVSNAFGGLAITDSVDGMASNNVLSAMAVEGEDDGGDDEEEEEPYASYVFGVGVYIAGSEDILISETPVTGFLTGVYVYDSYGIWFTMVDVTNSVHDGGWIEDSGAVVIEDCTFVMSGGDGLVVVESDVMVSNVVVANNFLYGIVVYGSSATIYNGDFSNNGEYGVWFEDGVDWIVDEEAVVNNNPVYFNGDLTVAEGGMLWLNLLMDFEITGDDSDGLAEITVEAGGMLTAIDVDFFMDESEYGYYYMFNVFGGLDFMNVLVTDALELYLGPTSTVEIQTSQIVYNVRNGIVVDGCAPVIISSTIAMNERNGISVINGASPRIIDCMIASNARGMYVRGGDMSEVTDNVFALNSEAGILVEQTTGVIRDNVFLLNNKEIYVKESIVSISDNQIGYCTLVDVIAQFAPLLGLMQMGEPYYVPLLDIWVSPEALSELLFGHIGVYAVDGSDVTTTDNEFGMLTTAIMVVDSKLTSDDDILSRTLMVPYMSSDGVIREMSLPVPVYDGIIALNSDVTVNGGHIKVLDDAIFLDGSTAAISDAVLEAGDFSVYAIGDTEASLTNVQAGKVKAADSAVITVGSALTIVVKDPWGATLAGVPVGVRNAQDEIVAQERTDADGVVVVNVVSYVQTSSGKDYSMHPYKVNASFGAVDTSGYPGHDAEFSPAEKTVSIAVPEPTTLVVQSNVIVKYYLAAKATDPNGKVVAGANVVLMSATGTTYSGTTNAQGVFSALVVAYIQTPSGQDTSMEPYSITVTFPNEGEGYDGRAVFSPHVVTDSVTVEADTVQVVKTGIIMYYELTVTAKDKFNKSTPGVGLIVTDAAGTIVGADETGEDGTATFEVVGYIQAADGTMDVSMNPYGIDASFEKNKGEGSADMSAGDVAIEVHEIVEEFNWTFAIVIGLIGALLLGIVLAIIAKKD
jgi:parallel beta-helix repeat protein